MQLFLFFFSASKSNGGEKLNSIVLAWFQTDRKIQTRLISASFHLEQGWRSTMERCRNREEGGTERGRQQNKTKKKANGGDQYGLTITLVWARSNGKAYCIRTLDGSPWTLEWRSENRTNASHILLQPNRTDGKNKKPQQQQQLKKKRLPALRINWNQRLNTKAKHRFFLLVRDKRSKVWKKCCRHPWIFPLLPLASRALAVQSRGRCINPSNVQFSSYIINVFIIDKMPRVFPLEEISPICT